MHPKLSCIVHSKQSMPRSRHGIFSQDATLNLFVISYSTMILKLILHPAKPMLGTHIRTAVGVLETVIDPGSLFANREF